MHKIWSDDKSGQDESHVHPSTGRAICRTRHLRIYGTRLAVVKSFVYLGSTISHDGSLDNEIKERIAKASSAFGRLEERVWSDRNLTINTKLSVYKTCVLSALLYASEVWTVYQRHVKLLERFHQQCLRRILSIKWQNRTPDTEVLSKAHTLSISALLMRNQMRWAGHLIRMDDSRLPKQLFYGELASGARPQHKPNKRFRDEVKVNLKKLISLLRAGKKRAWIVTSGGSLSSRASRDSKINRLKGQGLGVHVGSLRWRQTLSGCVAFVVE